jgi:hypothetical protein
VSERRGRCGSVEPKRYAGFDRLGLTSGPRGKIVNLELLQIQKIGNKTLETSENKIKIVFTLEK